MSSFKGKRLPEISDDKLFEKFALDLWVSQHDGAHSTLYGRNGQAQFGVDVLIRAGGRLIGIQCKAVTKLDDKIIAAEVERAKGFEPALTELIVVTTAPHDAKLVSYAEIVTLDHKKSKLFEVAYHGWGDLLRMLEDHQWVVHKHFPEFFRSPNEPAVPLANAFRLPLDSDLNIGLSDEELALFCSEARWALKNESDAIFAVDQADEQRMIAMIAAIEAAGELDAEARRERSKLREMLAYLAPKMRKAEMAGKLLLTDELVRSPWLIGGCWPDTALTMRRLMPQIIKGSSRIDGGLTLKIRIETHPKIVGYLDLDVEDRAAFELQCEAFNPHYFVGGVPDLGTELGFRYALPAGIAGLVAYSIGHDVPIDTLQRDGTTGIYSWGLYPS